MQLNSQRSLRHTGADEQAAFYVDDAISTHVRDTYTCISFSGCIHLCTHIQAHTHILWKYLTMQFWLKLQGAWQQFSTVTHIYFALKEIFGIFTINKFHSSTPQLLRLHTSGYFAHNFHAIRHHRLRSLPDRRQLCRLRAWCCANTHRCHIYFRHTHRSAALLLVREFAHGGVRPTHHSAVQLPVVWSG